MFLRYGLYLAWTALMFFVLSSSSEYPYERLWQLESIESPSEEADFWSELNLSCVDCLYSALGGPRFDTVELNSELYGTTTLELSSQSRVPALLAPRPGFASKPKLKQFMRRIFTSPITQLSEEEHENELRLLKKLKLTPYVLMRLIEGERETRLGFVRIDSSTCFLQIKESWYNVTSICGQGFPPGHRYFLDTP